MLLVLFICAACNGTDVQEEAVDMPVKNESAKEENSFITMELLQKDDVKNEEAEEVLSAQAGEDLKENGAAEEKELIIYYSNRNADGLETETIPVADITPEVIISNLAKHNIVSIDTRVNECHVSKMEGQDKTVITLDMSKAFGEYIKTMGSSGETVIIAALTDTFLEAFQADSLRLSVEGAVLETGHGIYAEELTYWDIDLNTDLNTAAE